MYTHTYAHKKNYYEQKIMYINNKHKKYIYKINANKVYLGICPWPHLLFKTESNQYLKKAYVTIYFAF